MGVKGLWQHLPITDERQTLLELAVKHGFEANPQGLRAYRIGIDASLWFFHAQKVQIQIRNGELQMFFHHCCRLLETPILPLFVFDGPQRPSVKRKKKIRILEGSQLNDIRQLITAFGFECVTAPGEAEAALAQLNTKGIIDAVLSDDGDCFLFGAKTVLRNVSSDKKPYMEYLNVYDIRTLESSHYSRDELIFIALLNGGDYDPGLAGCGITTATNLRQFGFGKHLVEHWRIRTDSADSEMEWQNFLSLWREEVRQKLQSNALGNANRTAAHNLTDEFPQDQILVAYTNPVVFDADDLENISNHLWKSKLSLLELGRACLN